MCQDFLDCLRRQLKLDKFTIRRDNNSTDSFTIYSKDKNPYYLYIPYGVIHQIQDFNSFASPYQKAIDKNIIMTHIKHCESLARNKESDRQE
jgi:hypothetical protein